jgi:hypothetical protein
LKPVQNLLPSCLLSKDVRIEIHITVIMPVVLCECETWSLALSEECRLKEFKNRVLRRVFGLKADETERAGKTAQ